MHKNWEPPITTSDGLLDNRVRKVAYDPDKDELWFDTRSGVCMYKPIFQTWYLGGEFPYDLVQSHKADTLLPVFFMDYGYHFLPEGYITDLYLNRYPVTDYYLDDWDDLWLGSWGLNAGIGSLRDLELHMFKFGLFDSDVNAIHLDGGVIWTGGKGFYTASEGITRFVQKKNIWEYFQADRINGLETNQVNSIEADSQYVWFGTESGLARYDKKKKLWITLTSFSGLRDDWISALKSDGEVLWVGTKSGLNFYWSKKDTLGYFRNELVNNVSSTLLRPIPSGCGWAPSGEWHV